MNGRTWTWTLMRQTVLKATKERLFEFKSHQRVILYFYMHAVSSRFLKLDKYANFIKVKKKSTLDYATLVIGAKSGNTELGSNPDRVI